VSHYQSLDESEGCSVDEGLRFLAENHAISPEDRALFDRLNIGESTTTIIPHDKVMVNKGETMRTEHIIHHVNSLSFFFLCISSEVETDS